LRLANLGYNAALMTSKTNYRPSRIGDQIKRELASLVRTSVRDPRLAKITLLEVEMSPDLSHATVFFSIFDEADVPSALEAFKKAAGFLRTKIGAVMKLRSVPHLHFKYDASVIKGQKLSALIDDAVNSDQGNKKCD
jgi:ribosome-binding factor A